MAVRTIFSMAEDCARDQRQGWYEFVRDYGAIARTLLTHFFPTLTPEIDNHVAAVFARARADGSAWFSSIKFSNEREFLVAFRNLVFAYGREQERVPAPQISLEQLAEIMKDLPVVEREMLWLFIKGYDAPQIGRIVSNLESTAVAVKKVADERLRAVIPGSAPDAFALSARVLMVEAEKKKSEKCLPLKTFNDMINGQLSWRERDLTEEHIKDCFYCLDRYTSFCEGIRLRKDAQTLAEPEIEALLEKMGAPRKQSKGLLAKLFS
ncbi:MAG TPA: hypothetical protein VMS96_07180 [Terriglobales bacterium]|nr:hypothetical protein [Terriglobales bacterium]